MADSEDNIKKDRDLHDLIDKGAEVAGGAVGGTLGFFSAGPMGAAIFGAGGALTVVALKYIGREISERFFGLGNDRVDLNQITLPTAMYSIDDLFAAGEYMLATELLKVETKGKKAGDNSLVRLGQLALCYQKIGNTHEALHYIDEYESIAGRLPNDIAVIKGKCYSQSGSASRLRDYIRAIAPVSNSDKVGGHLAPLYWRLAILSPDSGAAANDLARQRELATSTYQIAHNRQCLAIRDIMLGLGNYDRQLRLLYESFLMYKKSSLVGHFYKVELHKCLISNLMLSGLADSLHGRTRQQYKKLLAARLLFNKLGIRTKAEAMAEISSLVAGSFPEAYRLVFFRGSADMMLRNHSRASIIAPIYAEVAERVAAFGSVEIMDGLCEDFFLEDIA